MLNNPGQSTPAPAVSPSPDGNASPSKPAKKRDGLSFIHSSLDDAGLAPAEFRVYCHVSRRAGRYGVCTESLSNIAQHCGYCDDTTRAALKILTARRMLRRNDVPGEGVEYRLNPPAQWLPALTPLRENRRGKKSKRSPAENSQANPSEKITGKGIPSEGIPMKAIIRSVNLVNTPLTNLTASAASMKRIARDIASNQHGWCYDNCKVQAADISAPSLESVLLPYADTLTEKMIHDCWQEGITRAHMATVDQLANKNPAGYAVACFKEQLSAAANKFNFTPEICAARIAVHRVFEKRTIANDCKVLS